MGDPAGIGPDITLASWLDRVCLALPPFVLLGDPDVLAERARRLCLAVPIERVADLEAGQAAFWEALPVLPVRGAGVGGDKAMIVAAIEEATAAALAGRALGLVT
jgi:4-hydroxythreonine-4-phosphate dehydrogenase